MFDKEKFFERNSVIFVKNIEEFVNIKKFYDLNTDDVISISLPTFPFYLRVAKSDRHDYGNNYSYSTFKGTYINSHKIYEYEDVLLKEKIKFNLEDFKKNKFAVKFENKEEYVEFNKWIEKNTDLKYYIAESNSTFQVYKNIVYYCYMTGLLRSDMLYFKQKYNDNIINYSDLIFEEKESYKMKYKSIKPISGKAIVEAKACESDSEKFIAKFGFHKEVVWNEEVEKWIIENISGGINWGVQNGFLKIIEEYYDKNKFWFCKVGPDICYIVKIKNEFFLMGLIEKNNIGNVGKTNIKDLMDYYNTFEYKSFDTFDEGYKYFMKKEETKEVVDSTTSDRFRTFQKLFKEFMRNRTIVRCGNINCPGVKCGDCMFN